MLETLRSNPFVILQVALDADAAEIERQGRRLLHLFEAGVASAGEVETPFGPQPRTANDVRVAMSVLRDPDKRLAAEVWLQAPQPSPRDAKSRPPPAFDNALSALRWWA